jgi:type III secretion system YscQ/HrcQ family protein
MNLVEPPPTPLRNHPALVKVGSSLVKATQALFGYEWPAFRMGDDTLQVRFGQVNVVHAEIQFGVRCAGCDYEVQVVDADVLGNLRLAISPQIPISLQRASVMHALQPLLESIQTHLSCTLDLSNFRTEVPAWSWNEALGLTIVRQSIDESKTRQTDLLLRALQPEGWAKLLTSDRLRPDKTRPTMTSMLASIPMTVSVWGESVAITMAELAEIELGDFLILRTPAVKINQLKVSLRTPCQTLCGIVAVLEGHKLTISSATAQAILSQKPAKSFRANDDEKYSMIPIQSKSTEEGDATQNSTHLNTMRVEIEMELARISLPITTLQKLSVGQVFDVDRAIDSGNITLWCGGQRIGVGQLVAIGDNLGVRIVELGLIPLCEKD